MIGAILKKITSHPAVLLGIIFILLGLLIGGGLYIFKYDNDGSSLIILKASVEPYKIKPQSPGGLQLNSTDSPVLSFLDSDQGEGEGKLEVLRPPESAPEPPPIKVTEAPTAESHPKEVKIPKPVPPRPKAEENDTVKSPPKEVRIPKPIPPRPKVEEETTSPSPEEQNLNYVVQFAAFKKEESAIKTVASLADKHKDRLNGVQIDAVQEEGYWRVITERMTREQAQNLCVTLQGAGQDCILKQKIEP